MNTIKLVLEENCTHFNNILYEQPQVGSQGGGIFSITIVALNWYFASDFLLVLGINDLHTTVEPVLCDRCGPHKNGDRFNLCQVIYSQFGLAIHQNDHQARRRFVEWAQNEIAVVPDFNKRILFSDEAHFWLNGYVNKQNCRIWREANPQVYVETPLLPEKLTVWCTLWAGGILLQKRRRPQSYSQW
ncbi:hypothetical protein TNCV_4774361 [Trichonephila clavipes]|nr:hypothetical protein TNCV_4774361 [Trichonephila clavipes]